MKKTHLIILCPKNAINKNPFRKKHNIFNNPYYEIQKAISKIRNFATQNGDIFKNPYYEITKLD